MTRMAGPDSVVMCNLINTHTHTHTHCCSGHHRPSRCILKTEKVSLKIIYDLPLTSFELLYHYTRLFGARQSGVGADLWSLDYTGWGEGGDLSPFLHSFYQS